MITEMENTIAEHTYPATELYKYIYASYAGLFTIMKKDRTTFHVVPEDSAKFKKWLDENGVIEVVRS